MGQHQRNDLRRGEETDAGLQLGVSLIHVALAGASFLSTPRTPPRRPSTLHYGLEPSPVDAIAASRCPARFADHMDYARRCSPIALSQAPKMPSERSSPNVDGARDERRGRAAAAMHPAGYRRAGMSCRARADRALDHPLTYRRTMCSNTHMISTNDMLDGMRNGGRVGASQWWRRLFGGSRADLAVLMVIAGLTAVGASGFAITTA